MKLPHDFPDEKPDGRQFSLAAETYPLTIFSQPMILRFDKAMDQFDAISADEEIFTQTP